MNLREHKIKKCPPWPELSAKRLMPILYQSAEFRAYLPNNWALEKRELNREFLYTLMANVDKEYFENVVQEAVDIR